jgi:hypothetical protein
MALELIQITNDPRLAAQLNAWQRELGPFRLMVDLESMGKAERQAGRNTFVSAHDWPDIALVRAAAPGLPLMVRLNPLHAGTSEEIDHALAGGADRLMLPMFTSAADIATFAALVAGRLPFTALLETQGALKTLPDWVEQTGMDEVFVGLNDLHVSLGLPFMFVPLANGVVAAVATACHQAGRRFGFGGIARMDEGLLPGRAVLGEHERLGSKAVILSRTFHHGAQLDLLGALTELRAAESALCRRDAMQRTADSSATQDVIRAIATHMTSVQA